MLIFPIVHDFAFCLPSQIFYPNLRNFFTQIYPSYPWHFATLHTPLISRQLCTSEVFVSSRNQTHPPYFPQTNLHPKISMNYKGAMANDVLPVVIFLFSLHSLNTLRDFQRKFQEKILGVNSQSVFLGKETRSSKKNKKDRLLQLNVYSTIFLMAGWANSYTLNAGSVEKD